MLRPIFIVLSLGLKGSLGLKVLEVIWPNGLFALESGIADIIFEVLFEGVISFLDSRTGIGLFEGISLI